MTSQTPLNESELVRLLQTGYVLEGIVEGRSNYHQRLPVVDGTRMSIVCDLLEEAHVESKEHRNQLQELINSFGASCISSEVIEQLVETQYDRETVENIDDILHDQLLSELSAYKFYDELLVAIAESDMSPSINRNELIATLEKIRSEELEGIDETLSVMETFDVSVHQNLDCI